MLFKKAEKYGTLKFRHARPLSFLESAFRKIISLPEAAPTGIAFAAKVKH
jgi:hypothetical protein